MLHMMSTGNFIEVRPQNELGIWNGVAVSHQCTSSSADNLAAFNAINHFLFLNHKSQLFGVLALSFNCLQSFISDWKQYVSVGSEQSSSAICTSGVPHNTMCSVHCCSPCTSHAVSAQIACIFINMPMICSCTRPFNLVLMRLLNQSWCLLKTSLAGF